MRLLKSFTSAAQAAVLGALFIGAGCGCSSDNGTAGTAGTTGSTASTATTGGPSASGAGLTGSGSTLIAPIMSQWTDAYQKDGNPGVNYQAIGSGGGIKGLIDKTVDFAGSDAPMNDDETAKAKDPVLHFPVVIGSVAIAYNIAGVQSGLKLTGPVIADIFLGNIQKWNDPKIASLNPGVNLPDAAIFTAHRSEGSGTTFIFTDYLSKVSPEWKQKVGNGKSVSWPGNGIGAKGSDGVAGVIKNHPNSICYVELAYADQNKIPYASVQNASGAFISPSADAASAAADGVKIPDDMKVSITNTSNPKGYPIVGFSWLITYEKSARTPDLKKFLSWIFTKGEPMNSKLTYGPIPDSVVQREEKMLDTMQ